MQEEMDAFTINNTWSLVHPMDGMKIIGSNKWVFMIKKDSDSKIQRKKGFDTQL